MAFKIVPPATFAATVLISVPGLADPQPLAVEFRNLGADGPRKLADTKAQPEVLLEMVASWDAVNDDGQPVPVTVEALAELCNKIPLAPQEIAAGYFAALHEARRKN